MYFARSQGTSSQGTNCNHCAEVGLQEVPQVYAACGRGARSTLRMLRPGIAVAEVAVTELPARPTAVWTVRKTQEDAYDDLIVISFGDDKATLVLRVGDTVQEVNDSGLEGKTATLGVQLLANNSILQARPAHALRNCTCSPHCNCSSAALCRCLSWRIVVHCPVNAAKENNATSLQVHQGGLRLLSPERRINKWAPPGRRTVVACATNTQQVVIALLGGDLTYFELNPNGQLLEVEKKEGLADVSCLAIAQVRSRMLHRPALAAPHRCLHGCVETVLDSKYVRTM